MRIRGQLIGEGNDLFLYIESYLRNLYELKVGDRIECVLIAVEHAPRREYCSCEGELVGGSSGCRLEGEGEAPAEPRPSRDCQGAADEMPLAHARGSVPGGNRAGESASTLQDTDTMKI